MQNLNQNQVSSFRFRSRDLTKFDPCQRAWVEVNSAAIEANTSIIKSQLRKGCLLMAVVKADGYGHGAETVARAALNGGANYLGVATLQEGIELRQLGFDCPILLLGNLITKEDLQSSLVWDLTPTLSSIREALICQNLAFSRGSKYQFPVHLKVDTGMTRLGCDLKDAYQLVKNISSLNNLQLQGIYSHLALADVDHKDSAKYLTELQQQKFEDLLLEIKSFRKNICVHLANSAGTLKSELFHYDMVRVGLALYGHTPNGSLGVGLGLQPALTVKARVTLIRDVPSGTGVSYGHAFRTSRKSRLAVVAIGYADGVQRALSGKISALIDGQLFPQVGSIAMDQLVLDITKRPDIKIGSIVTLLGTDGDISITPHEWSDLCGSIPWEILCSFRHRLPRLIIEGSGKN